MTDTPEKEEKAEGKSRPLPMFYKDIRVLNATVHAKISFKPKKSFSFAKDARVIPLNLPEFAHAARFYPIVFSKTSPAVPLAVVGVRDNENLFVDPKTGEWDPATYIPAYVRRYPFIFANDGEGGDKRAVCIDHNQDFIEESEAAPLMLDGKPSEVVEKAIKFCQAYETSARLTEEFCREVEAQDLLDEKQASVPTAENQGVRLTGFRVINTEKFTELPGDLLAKWQKSGVLAGIYTHIFAGNSWGELIRRLELRQQIKSSPKGTA